MWIKQIGILLFLGFSKSRTIARVSKMRLAATPKRKIIAGRFGTLARVCKRLLITCAQTVNMIVDKLLTT